MRDAVQAIVTHLAAQTAVRDIVGLDDDGVYRVYGEEIAKESVIAEMPRPVVVVRRVPGPGDYGTCALEDGVVDVACFGETAKDAEELREAVRGVLKALERRVVGGTLIHWVVPASAARHERDPDGKWPVKAEGWRFLASETVVV